MPETGMPQTIFSTITSEWLENKVLSLSTFYLTVVAEGIQGDCMQSLH